MSFNDSPLLLDKALLVFSCQEQAFPQSDLRLLHQPFVPVTCLAVPKYYLSASKKKCFLLPLCLCACCFLPCILPSALVPKTLLWPGSHTQSFSPRISDQDEGQFSHQLGSAPIIGTTTSLPSPQLSTALEELDSEDRGEKAASPD